MIHPINASVTNTALYYGAKLYSDKNNPPKTEVTSSSASAAAKGENEKLKTSITGSSAKEVAQGTAPVLETKSVKNAAPPVTIASATVASNTPSVNLAVNLNAESEKEYKDAKAGKTKETPALKAKEALKVIASREQSALINFAMKKSVSAESVLSAYKQ